MARVLLQQCLSFPALSPAPQQQQHLNGAAQEQFAARRDAMEEMVQEMRLKNTNADATRQQLETSIAALKRELESEVEMQALARLVQTRVAQSRLEMDQGQAFARACLGARDALVLEILELEREMDAIDFDLKQALLAKERLEAELAGREKARQAKRARLARNEGITRLTRERHALRQLFFVLIMESGVDWQSDDVLRRIVWGFR